MPGGSAPDAEARAAGARASEPPDPVRGDAYVDRLADRLTGSHAAASAAPPMPAIARRTIPPARLSARPAARSVPPAPGAPAPPTAPPARMALESSDVRRMPPVDRDDLAELPPPPSDPPEPFAEFEQDDLAAEATAIDDREALASESTQIIQEAPAMPLLFVEAGRDQGREYVLVEGETTVGRGIDNEVILADVSVSRRHLRILRDGDLLTLRDTGSGNGTLVNGRRVSALTLSDGDRIELGETVLVVRVPGAELGASTAPDPDAMSAPDNTTDETAVPMTGPSFEQQLRVGGSWSLPPPASSLPPAVPSSTGWATGERTSSVVLDRRTLLLAAAGIAVGASVLGALIVALMLRGDPPPPVASTLPVEPGAPIAVPPLAPGAPGPRVVAPNGTPAAAPTRGTAGAAAGAAGGTPAAAGAATGAAGGAASGAPAGTATGGAATTSPSARGAAAGEGSRAAAAGTGAAGDARSSARAGSVDAPERTPRSGRDRDPRPVRAAREPTPRRGRGPAADPYVAAYRAGDFAAAARTARSSGHAARALQIDQFATHYRNSQSAPAGSAAAISALERAIAIDNQIVRGGHYGARLRSQLVAAYLQAAQASMGARPQDACRRVQLALRLDGSSSRAQSLARQCESQAQRLIAQAAAAERSDPGRARALYHAVLPMVPSSSATYTRARQRVDAIARSRPVDEDE